MFETTETHNFAEAGGAQVATDSPDLFELSTVGHLAFFRIDLLEMVDLNSSVFSLSGN